MAIKVLMLGINALYYALNQTTKTIAESGMDILTAFQSPG